MDTRKLTVETYACSCKEGTEYGLVIKQLHRDTPEGEEYAGDDGVASFMTRCRHEETAADQPDTEVWNLNGEQTMLTELVRRWNSFPALVEVLKEAADLLYASMDEKQPGGSYGHDCHLAHRKAEELLNTL